MHPRRPSARIVIENAELAEIDEEVTREILTSEVLSRHTTDLSRYKDERGEFKQWLHIFHIANGNAKFKTTTVIPWLTDETEVDLDFHRAATAIGAYVKYPLNWRSFSWVVPPMATTPVYRVFTNNPSQQSFLDAIRGHVHMNPGRQEMLDPVFWDRMKQLVLVPRADGGLVPNTIEFPQRSYDDANSRLGEDCAAALRGGQHGPSDRAAGLRQVPGDRARDHSDPE